MDKMFERLQAMTSKADRLDGVRQAKTAAVDSARSLALGLREEVMHLDKVHKGIAYLMTKAGMESLGEMDKLVNFGIKTVMPDRDVLLKSSINDSGKRISINMNTIARGSEAVMDDHGSVSVVQSLLLRILTIIKLKQPRVLFLDETLAAVDSIYINNAGTLLSEIAERMGFDILLVTHNPGAAEALVYRANYTEHNNELTFSKEGIGAASVQH